MAIRTPVKQLPRHRQVFETLQAAIVSGKYKRGQKLPSEASLVRQFGTSRITVGRAVRDLQLKGLVERRAGSGTFVRSAQPADRDLIFGLLIPELGQTEIFEPICQGMARAPQVRNHALLWGNTTAGELSKEEQAWQLCQQYGAQNVAGVFFAPLELPPAKDQVNHRILGVLEKVQIPVLLLDRDVFAYPQRSAYDLVGIDNRRAGYMITEHLLKLHSRRIAFMAYPHSAPTVEGRIAGYREALFAYGAPVRADLVQRLDPADANAVRRVMDKLHPEAFVCANDRTAGNLMHALMALGYRIPRDVRIAGIDDVEYAHLLPIPLTTIHQPCREVGEAAIAAMLDRVARPDLPAREILLDCRLVVRQSCGAASVTR